MDKETLYQQFTEKILPKIQEGLVITKDYFTDLFGRFINYLIVSDIVFLVIGLILILIGSLTIKFSIKWFKKDEDGLFFIITVFGFIICIFGFIDIIIQILDIAKAMYIPEIRVYEELKPIINSTTNK